MTQTISQSEQPAVEDYQAEALKLAHELDEKVRKLREVRRG